MKLKSVLAGMAVAAAGLGWGLAGAVPASAASSDCASGYTCFWGNTNYTTTSYGCNGGGDWVRFQYSIGSFVDYFYCLRPDDTYTRANDRVASVYNNGTRCSSALYVDAGFGTLAVAIARQSGFANLTSSGKRTDLSSGQFTC